MGLYHSHAENICKSLFYKLAIQVFQSRLYVENKLFSITKQYILDLFYPIENKEHKSNYITNYNFLKII